jgi:hypothetical protein
MSRPLSRGRRPAPVAPVAPVAPAARPPPQTPADFSALLNGFTQEAAVADADHDFSGQRAGSSLFRSVYINSNFTRIGTPGDSNIVDIKSEFDILAKFRPFNTPASSNFYDNPSPATFQAILNEVPDDDQPAPREIGRFRRFEGDDEYIVEASLVAIKGVDYDWKRDPQQIYDFMNPHERTDGIAFTIDACSVKFYERMVGDTGSRQQNKLKAYYLLPREGINDAAGKVNIRPHENTIVEIEVKEDTVSTADYNVLYPITDTTRGNNLTELECFFSKFNLSLTPVKAEKNGVPYTTLNITDKSFTRQVMVLKHSTEDSHPNAVPTLSEYIEKLIATLITSTNTQQSYYAALQQKRSGDWLQVLACLQPERFGLPKDMRPMIVSVDKICIAYALFVGVDACFTYYQQNSNKYWLIRFHKHISALTDAQKDEAKRAKLLGLITKFPKQEEVVVVAGETYEGYKTRYTAQYTAIEAQIKTEFTRELAAAPPEGRVISLEPKIKTILTKAMQLCAFRAILPKIKGNDNNGVFPFTAASPITTDNYNVIYDQFSNYRHNYMCLKEAIDAKRSALGILNGEGAINNYIESLSKSSGAANSKREKLIDKLKIFSGVFSGSNSEINGIGIFSFLNQQLNPGEKRSLIDTLRGYIGKIEKTEDKTKINDYKKFIDTLRYLTDIDAPIAENTGVLVPEQPLVQEGGNGDLAALVAVIMTLFALLYSMLNTDKINLDFTSSALLNAIEASMYQNPENDTPKGATRAAQMAIIEGYRTKVPFTRWYASSSATDDQRIALARSVTPARGVGATRLRQDPVPPPDPINDSLFVSDYGPTLAILRGKPSIGPRSAEELRSINDRLKRIQLSGQGGGGLSQDSIFNYFHNPLTSFYFLFRDLGWRLTLEDIGEHESCVRLSQLLEYVLFKYPDTQGYTLIEKYLYWNDLETYFLYFDSTHGHSKCVLYFLRDIMFKVRDTYLNRPETAEEKYIQISSIEDVFGGFEESTVEPSEQVTKNLELMRGLIEKIKEVEEGFGNLGAVARAAIKTMPKNTLNTLTNFNTSAAALGHTLPANRRPFPVVEALQVIEAYGGASRRKYRKTKRKRKHNKRKTKKRKNFVV